MQLRPEQPADAPAIASLIAHAFDGHPHSGGTEPAIVRELRAGIGSRLMTDGLARLKALGAEGCVVLGEPAYYGRWGFAVHEGLVYPGVPPEYFMALAFAGGVPRGEVAYHAAFAAQA